ncbi:hypothetical protein [Streptantibioticus ferralitis]|uniref:JmjC domain-containing protein n=1 Tax=Streptantibioticus ferralitis TaxID=236510 RepID=A0ABT5ZB53_9ACTN|nr:hypothetical protein [Streptantibioticus ferralitis]MDF2261009.1 hypothetical protein [Streptantibioticus ferralitis]
MTTREEFTASWRTPPNFRIAPTMIPFAYTFPPAQEVLDLLRKDPETKITILGDGEPAVRTARVLAVRTAPVEEIATWPFRLVHFNLSRFYGNWLHDFQTKVMIPWRTFLAAQGFTWQRCAPALFISGHRCSSTYHVDNPNGLVWQVEGTKIFNSYRDPDRMAPASAVVNAEIAAEVPPAHDPAERLSAKMEPGDMLWSHALTPHWVTGDTPLSMNINIFHSGLCHQGRYSAREEALRQHWDAHPEQAWQNLRSARY